MRLVNCHNFHDFRLLAKQRLPSPIFNYIDGAAEDERTYARNTASFDDCDLVPNVLRSTESVDMQVSIMGQRLDLPIYCSPTALQRVFHHEGERIGRCGSPQIRNHVWRFVTGHRQSSANPPAIPGAAAILLS